MLKAPIPENDQQRLDELYRYKILDQKSEQELEDIVHIAHKIIGTKICLISLVDKSRQWFLSRIGLNATETPREVSFCGHAILNDEIFEIPDASKDLRFKDNPLFLQDPHVTFYAGAPLITPSGYRIGTLCVVDDKPKKLTEDERDLLTRLSRQIVSHFELRYQREQMAVLNERQEMILKGANLGAWDWWLNTNQVHFDQRWCEMLGLDPDKTPQELSTWDKLVHPDDKEQAYADIKKHLEGQTEYYENIHRLKHADGTWKWILDRGRISERDEQGKPIRFTGTHFDITDEKRRQINASIVSDLRANFILNKEDKKSFFDHLLQLLLKQTDSEYGFIGEVLLDNNGNKILKNYALTNIAWNEETKKFYDKNAPKGLIFSNLKTLFGEVITSGKLLMTNHASTHPKAAGIPKGHPALEKFCGIPFHYNGKLIAMAGLANRKSGYDQAFFDDEISFLIDPIAEIIHGVQIENELEYNKKLINHNAKLASIGQLSAGVSHEINNPLAIISGNIAFVKKDLTETTIDRSKIFDRLTKMQNSVERISKIVNGLKNFARFDSSTHTDVELKPIAEEVFHLLKHLFESTGITFHFNTVDLKHSKIKGNQGKLEQVFVNLLTNAKDALITTANPIIKFSLFNDANNKIVVTIEDNGKGIEPEIMDKIFDPFFTTKEINKGTGIGLSIVSTIINEHNAKLEVKSVVGQGTIFKIIF